MAIRMNPDERRAEVLDAALRTAAAVGFMRMTREDVARAAGCTPGLVSARLGTMKRLRDEVMKAAVRREVLPVIGEGIALRHPHAIKAPADLQKRAAASLLRTA
jgi:AcrR family transcriptional regulator